MLNGKTALVTGAASAKGIGRASARALLEAGANVVLCDLPGKMDFATLQAEMPEFANRVDWADLDVTRADDAAAAVALAQTRFGGLDILVNNAGVGNGDPAFLSTTEADWALALNVNVMGMVTMCRAALPALEGRDGAAIVNIASLSGLRAIPYIPACYTASKFAAVGLTKQLALEYAPKGVRVNAVCPGSVRTEMMETAMAHIADAMGITPAEAEAEENATIGMGRPAEPDEIGQFVAQLAGPASSYLTGEAVTLSGAMFTGI